MQKTLLGGTGMEISQIIYGGIVSTKDGQQKSDEYVKYAIDHGINYFDIAPTYGDGQEKLGNSLVPYRKDIFLACKTNQRKAEDAKPLFEKSLEQLHTDHIDVNQMHELESVEQVEAAFAKDGVMSMLVDLKAQGVIRHLGITCHSQQAALRALELYDFETVLFPTNWGLAMRNQYGEALAAKIKEKNIGFLGMKSMIERAWDEGEKATSRFSKSWCKPISEDDAFTIAAIRHAFSMGINAMVPPGNFESFSFAVEHADEILAPLTEQDKTLLQEKFKTINGRYFFNLD